MNYGRGFDDMLGTIDKQKTTEQTTDTRYRDIAEYATINVLYQVMGDLRKQGIMITPSLMKGFRDNWERDGEPMDFTHMKAKPSDFVRLLRSTGATSFGKLEDYPSLEKGVADLWQKCRDEYDKNAKDGKYLHAITDPAIRENILDTADEPMTKGIFVHRGKSARELKPGNVVKFYEAGQADDKRNYFYYTKIATAAQKKEKQEERNGFQ